MIGYGINEYQYEMPFVTLRVLATPFEWLWRPAFQLATWLFWASYSAMTADQAAQTGAPARASSAAATRTGSTTFAERTEWLPVGSMWDDEYL